MAATDEPRWELDDERRLHDEKRDAARDFDTALRALAGGALAISIAFVHQIAHHPGHKWLLGLSWMLFAASLALNLLSFLTSGQVSHRMLHEMRDPKTTEIQEGALTDVLNWGSFLTFLAGLIGLVLFALLNI
jgi:hypothetical protein